MPSSHKKVIVRRFTADRVHGYLPASGFVAGGSVDLLGLDGRRVLLPLEDVRSIAFVRDFSLGDGAGAARRTFSTRPRGKGLWVRLALRQDGEEMEGLAAADLALLDDVMRDGGLFLTPPDTRGNTQRLFVPRLAIVEMRLLGVISSAAERRGAAASAAIGVARGTQEELFDSVPAEWGRSRTSSTEGTDGDT